LRRLDPDPQTAPHVRWIFMQRLAGHSVRVIAAMLDDRGIPSPAAADRDPDRCRAGRRWSPRAVDAILRNPRYTGRQVWNRYGIDHCETGPGARSAGAVAVRRPNSRDLWVISTLPGHPELISEQTFVHAQQISAVAQPDDGVPRRYLLGGLVLCARCGRRAESLWAHRRPAYRCRHGTRGARPADMPLPFYAREYALLRAAAAELDLRTGRGQNWWDDDSVAAHLRENGLRIRCGNDAFEIDGDIPKTTEDVAVTRSTTSRQKRDKMVHRKRTIKRKKTLAYTGE
jgi:site-specific DNA recombinase